MPARLISPRPTGGQDARPPIASILGFHVAKSREDFAERGGKRIDVRFGLINAEVNSTAPRVASASKPSAASTCDSFCAYCSRWIRKWRRFPFPEEVSGALLHPHRQSHAHCRPNAAIVNRSPAR